MSKTHEKSNSIITYLKKKNAHVQNSIRNGDPSPNNRSTLALAHRADVTKTACGERCVNYSGFYCCRFNNTGSEPWARVPADPLPVTRRAPSHLLQYTTLCRWLSLPSFYVGEFHYVLFVSVNSTAFRLYQRATIPSKPGTWLTVLLGLTLACLPCDVSRSYRVCDAVSSQ